MSILLKLAAWIPVNLASIFAIIQGVIKLLKEVITAMINILFPLFPDNGSFEKTVLKARDLVNKIDDFVNKAKEWLLKFGVKPAATILDPEK